MERAKDLNGLLTLLQTATQTVGSATRVLSERPDTESQVQFAELRKLRDELEFAGRDLAGGVIDLRELPFDEHAWTLLFSEPVIPLASEEPEPEPVPYVEPPLPRTEEQDDLFDFDAVVSDHGLGIPPDLLEGIELDVEVPYDDCPTLTMPVE